jgi:hypothetical protein
MKAAVMGMPVPDGTGIVAHIAFVPMVGWDERGTGSAAAVAISTPRSRL